MTDAASLKGSISRRKIRTTFTLMMAVAGSVAPVAYGQSSPTASQRYQLSVFGAGTGVYTGVGGGRNVGITAGVDLGFRSYFSLSPSLEIRGTSPIDKGQVASERNVLGGLKVAKHLGRFDPYVDILFGRGEITYGTNGYPDPTGTFQYLKSPSNVISPGVGLDYSVSHHFALKADFQIQRYTTPVTVSGSLRAKAISGGLIYRFDFNHQPRRR